MATTSTPPSAIYRARWLRDAGAAAAAATVAGCVSMVVAAIVGTTADLVAAGVAPKTDFSAFAKASADWKRSFGSFAMDIRMISLRPFGRSGRRLIGGGGACWI